MCAAETCGATQEGWVMVERSDRMWSTGEGSGKPLQYSCLENPVNSMKNMTKGCICEDYVFPISSLLSQPAQLVKNPPAMQETLDQSLGWEDLLEKGTATHFSILGLENSMDCTVRGVAKGQTQLSDFH